MDKKFDLLTLGEIMLRLSPQNNERISKCKMFEKHIGGAEMNVACGVSLTGLRTGVISKIPNSEIGDYVRNKVRFNGVSDDYLVYDQSKNARLGVYYYEMGAFPRKPQVVYDRAGSSITTIKLEDFPEDMYTNTRCFHTSGITLALSQQCRETTIAMIKKFKEAGALISFDVNFRGNLWTGAEAKECIEGILPYVDIFFCSEDTAKLTFGKTGDVREILKSFTEEYPISIVAATQRTVHSPKQHSFGSVIYNAKEDKYYEEEPYRNIEVIDRIGSGDQYCAGVLYGLLSSDMDCQRALAYGNARSAGKNTIPGDMPSMDKDEIDNLIADHNDKSGYKSEMKR
ncbi:MAG: sugar kinase [Agathobacter sp.]|nr:sugar kinase [Agathobacter sp.]